MKYLTTLQAAHALDVSKQTLLNWLYAGKIPEPPRNGKGYRLWSETRVGLVKKLIAQGRLHTRTVVHRQPSNRPAFVAAYAREVRDFLRDGDIELGAFLGALRRAGGRAARRTKNTKKKSRPAAGRRGRSRARTAHRSTRG